MAIDNLNVMTSGIPAGQQTDKYSSQPGCLRSKNLDIFSSSKSVKGTAWSSASQSGSDIIKQVGDLVLKTDGKVYENGVLLVDPSVKFPVRDVSYDGYYGTYAPAQRGTPKDMIVKYEGNDRKTFTVFTDKASYTYNKNGYIISKRFGELKNCSFQDGTPERRAWTYDPTKGLCEGYEIKKTDNSAGYCEIELYIDTSGFSDIRLALGAFKYNAGHTQNAYPYLEYVQRREYEYYYDAQTNSFVPRLNSFETVNYGETYGTYDNPVYITRTVGPNTYGATAEIRFRRKKVEGASDYKRDDLIMVDFIGGPDPWRVESFDYWEGNTKVYEDSFESYNYLPNKQDRTLEKIGEYYWDKGLTTQTLYQYSESWKMNPTGQHVTDYDFVQYMARDNPSTMDVIDMIVWNENVQMIGNQDGNGYIIPCYLTGGKGTPYIAYGCTFKGAMNIDYLLYLVGEDRGVSQLRVFNGQELAPLIGGNRKDGADFIDTDEQYRFNGMMVEYKGNLILATEDNRIFEYGQTYGGKGGSFILDVPGTITGIKVQGNDLIVFYSITETVGGVETTYHYTTTYQDAETKKNFLNREAEYPIAIGNHLLEKEESDLYLSYKIPNKSCSLEFRGNANHYTFWTFKVENPGSMDYITNHFKINGTNGDYYLEYVENHGDEYTFKLVGDLPEQTNSTSKTLLYYDEEGEQWNTWATYEEYHHFRYIGEITADGYKEGEYRFHNLNNLLDLPKSHTLQIKVIGKGNNTGTPELFTVDLVANQRNRG